MCVQVLFLYSNQLTGTLPMPWPLPAALRQLSVAFNSLHGPLPSNWKLPEGLQVLSMLSGMLVVGFSFSLQLGPCGTCACWQACVGGYKSSCLSLPPLPSYLPTQNNASVALQVLELHSNQFSGTLDAAWRLPSTLHQLVLSNNSLTGSIPSTWPGTGAASLAYLAMDQNALEGPIPPDWQLPDSMQVRHAVLCRAMLCPAVICARLACKPSSTPGWT